MPATAIRILVAGKPNDSTRAILKRLAMRRWGSRTVESLQQARELLETSSFDIVLASESLPDGCGYELAGVVARHSGTLFVGVALSESSLWLPVIAKGTRVLGTRGLSPQLLLREMEAILGAHENAPAFAAAAASQASLGSRDSHARRPPGRGSRPRGW